MKKRYAVFVVFFLAILFSGCETSKGVGEGLSSTGGGIAQDAKNLWAGVMKADQWMRENMW